jgi:hypothetical protein
VSFASKQGVVYLVDRDAMPGGADHRPSPIVSSNLGATPVVWVVDQNALRTQPMLDPSTPHPILYAFDGTSMAKLYASTPTDLSVGGKYVTAAVAHGVVLVATDRVQAFGRRAK